MNFFWFRRDLRLKDNVGLAKALEAGDVQCVFIFDTTILNKLDKPFDFRMPFLWSRIEHLKKELNERGSDLWVFHGEPEEVWHSLLQRHKSSDIYCNRDYEPAAIARDSLIEDLIRKTGGQFHSFKDQVVFEKNEIMTDQAKPYTVFTPYKKKWLSSLVPSRLVNCGSEKNLDRLHRCSSVQELISLKDLGFENRADFEYPRSVISKSMLANYAKDRDFPGLSSATSRLGIHLRFGTLSVRELVSVAKPMSDVWLSELIWREFFMQILWNHPRVVNQSFRPQFDSVPWRDSESDFKRWCNGETGYPIVDAGMRELNQTGHMHNRVRMIVASFLTKHLLIHWLKGERYFASKLLDFDLSANNGNWQWAAGSGCDAAPYFRIFNPYTQTEKFDPDLVYVRKWVPDFDKTSYPKPIVDHTVARNRTLKAFEQTFKGAET